jgi:glycosyltransferase involved in cell wall biosynthesis
MVDRTCESLMRAPGCWRSEMGYLARMTGDAVRVPSSGLLVLCAGNAYDDTKVHDQHIAEQLAASGRVLYVDPPVSLARLARDYRAASSMSLRPDRMGPDLWRFTPLVEPYPARKTTVRVTSWLLAQQISRVVRRLGCRSCDIVSAWPLYDVFPVDSARRRVYWAQDDFVGLAEIHGQDQALLAAREAEIAEAADVVVASNPLVADAHKLRHRDVRLIPFGCDPATFAAVGEQAAEVRLSRPSVGVIGRLNSRIDMSLLEAAAERYPLLLVGPADPGFVDDRFRRLLASPSVQWVGPRPHAELRSYYRCIDVGLVPYADTAFNRGSFPLKLLEYLAAGLAVVSTDLPATRWLNTPLIHTATDRADFVGAMDRAVAERDDPLIVSRRREYARSNSWESRARSLRDVIDEVRHDVRGTSP